jgi:hypothetical protein
MATYPSPVIGKVWVDLACAETAGECEIVNYPMPTVEVECAICGSSVQPGEQLFLVEAP